MYRAFHPTPTFILVTIMTYQFSRLTTCLLLLLHTLFQFSIYLVNQVITFCFICYRKNKLIYTYTHSETFEGGCVERVEVVIVRRSNVCLMVLVVKFAGGISPKYYMPKPTTFDKVA